MFAGSVCRVEAWVASQGQPGSRALHLAACQETLQSWKNVWTLPSLWFKSCPGFCLGRCDTIYTGSCPAGAEWAGKHQQIFHPKAQEKRRRPGSRGCSFFKLLLTKIQAWESLHKFQPAPNDRMFSPSPASSQQDLWGGDTKVFLKITFYS